MGEAGGWVGGWVVGGWVGGQVAVWLSGCVSCGWVGGWVGGHRPKKTSPRSPLTLILTPPLLILLLPLLLLLLPLPLLLLLPLCLPGVENAVEVVGLAKHCLRQVLGVRYYNVPT